MYIIMYQRDGEKLTLGRVICESYAMARDIALTHMRLSPYRGRTKARIIEVPDAPNSFSDYDEILG